MKKQTNAAIEVEVLDPALPIAAYNSIKAGIAALAEKYSKTVFSVVTTKDMDAAKAARAEVREVRYNVESVRKELKAPALAYGKRIDDEAAGYTTALLAIEAPIDEVIKAEEIRKAAEKAERERLEAARIAAIEVQIDRISNYAIEAVGKSSLDISAISLVVSNIEITLEGYGQRSGEAMSVQQATLDKLQHLHATALEQETQAARLKAERDEFARQQAEQAAAAAEARRAEDKRIADERAKLAAEQAETKRLQELEAAKVRKELQATADKQAAETKRQAIKQAQIDKERAEFEAEKAAAAKLEQDKKDAEVKAAQDKADAEAHAAKVKADAVDKARADKAQAEAEELARRERVQFATNGPGDAEIVRVLAVHYSVETSDVLQWLAKFDSAATMRRVAA